MMVVAFLLAFVAHGGGEHIMGTAKAVTPASLTLTTTDGKDVVVAIDAATKLEKGKQKASVDDIKVGMRLVVHAKRESDTLHAQLIKLPAS